MSDDDELGVDGAAEDGTGASQGPEQPESASADSVPLSELRDDVESRKAASGGETGQFHQEDVGSVESEAVWADLLMGEEDASGLIDPTDIEEDIRGTFQIVPTTLCHRCEFFGEPPELHCTHDGTTIHETVDMDHYRVSACPMVSGDAQARNREE